MGTGALSNVALTLPFTRSPQQIAFSAALGAGMSIDWAGIAGYHLLPHSGDVTARISDVTLIEPDELRSMGVNVPKGAKWIGDILQDKLGYQLTDEQLARLDEIGRAAYRTEGVTTTDAIIFKDPTTGREMIQLALGHESLAKGMPQTDIVKWSGAGSEENIMATHVSSAKFEPDTTLESATPRPLDLTQFYLAPQISLGSDASGKPVDIGLSYMFYAAPRAGALPDIRNTFADLGKPNVYNLRIQMDTDTYAGARGLTDVMSRFISSAEENPSSLKISPENVLQLQGKIFSENAYAYPEYQGVLPARGDSAYFYLDSTGRARPFFDNSGNAITPLDVETPDGKLWHIESRAQLNDLINRYGSAIYDSSRTSFINPDTGEEYTRYTYPTSEITDVSKVGSFRGRIAPTPTTSDNPILRSIDSFLRPFASTYYKADVYTMGINPVYSGTLPPESRNLGEESETSDSGISAGRRGSGSPPQLGVNLGITPTLTQSSLRSWLSPTGGYMYQPGEGGSTQMESFAAGGSLLQASLLSPSRISTVGASWIQPARITSARSSGYWIPPTRTTSVLRGSYLDFGYRSIPVEQLSEVALGGAFTQAQVSQISSYLGYPTRQSAGAGRYRGSYRPSQIQPQPPIEYRVPPQPPQPTQFNLQSQQLSIQSNSYPQQPPIVWFNPQPQPPPILFNPQRQQPPIRFAPQRQEFKGMPFYPPGRGVNLPPKTTYTPFFYRELQHIVAPAYGVSISAFWDPLLKGYSNWGMGMLSVMVPRFTTRKEREILPRFVVDVHGDRRYRPMFGAGLGIGYLQQLIPHGLGAYRPRYSINIINHTHTRTSIRRGQVMPLGAGWLLPAQSITPWVMNPPRVRKGKR